MTNMDFNDADPQRAGGGSLIPDETVALVVATLRPGQAGPGGWLKLSNNTGCLMADFEFTVDGGEFDRRKFWGNFVTEGSTEGQQKAANITRSRLRAMLESAHGIIPGDSSQAAMDRRQVSGWQGFDGLRFCALIGVEQGALKDKTAGPNSERWPDKNVLRSVITPDDERYISPGPQRPAPPRNSTAAATQAPKQAAAGGKPSWAQ